MQNKDIIELIKNHSYYKNEKYYIKCKTLFELSQKYNVNLSTLSKICNKENIKISHCQLGCF